MNADTKICILFWMCSTPCMVGQTYRFEQSWPNRHTHTHARHLTAIPWNHWFPFENGLSALPASPTAVRQSSSNFTKRDVIIMCLFSSYPFRTATPRPIDQYPWSVSLDDSEVSHLLILVCWMLIVSFDCWSELNCQSWSRIIALNQHYSLHNRSGTQPYINAVPLGHSERTSRLNSLASKDRWGNFSENCCGQTDSERDSESSRIQLAALPCKRISWRCLRNRSLQTLRLMAYQQWCSHQIIIFFWSPHGTPKYPCMMYLPTRREPRTLKR